MIGENFEKVKARIAAACARVKRDPAEITLVAVTKGRNVDEIAQAVAAGAIDIGENMIQEALVKFNAKPLAISHKPIKWHMVGHLQTNKVKEAVGIFDLIHSIDSLRLAIEIDKQAAKINKIQDVLIEIKTSPEATKSGILPQEAGKLIEEIAHFKNIALKGFMTIAPLVDDPEKARPYFRILRELKDSFSHVQYAISHMPILSMGMTDDFEVAIEEGATMVRIGRAIFEGVSLRANEVGEAIPKT
ncbi:MAG: YggS family pyridoxal phosphate-dependent enzyme [Candidatus Omnitrophica bacterium]|nr:YggS family pyridoxal phosphate-dependent enzyme [Candidatus Omnitrophota bacterium]